MKGTPSSKARAKTARWRRINHSNVAAFAALGAVCTTIGFEKDQGGEFFPIALLAKPLILGQPLRLVCRRDRATAGGLIGSQQVDPHCASPLAALIHQGLQLPQRMRSAQVVTAFASGEVGRPEIVSRRVVTVFKHTLLGAKGGLAPVGVYKQMGVLRCTQVYRLRAASAVYRQGGRRSHQNDRLEPGSGAL